MPDSYTSELPRLSYRKVSDLKRAQQNNPVFSRMSLPEYSAHLNELTDSEIANEGLNPSWIKDVSATIDRGLEAIHAPQAGSALGGAIGDVVGLGPEGREAGAGLPRAIVNMAPLIAGGILSGGAAPLIAGAGAIGTGLTAGLSGADTYEKTGSAGRGLFSAALAGALPTVAHAGGQAALRYAGADVVEGATKKLVGETLGQKVAGYAGTQGAAIGLMEAGHQVESLATGQGFDTSKQHIIQSLVSQAPFLAFDLPTLFHSPPIEAVAIASTKRANAAMRAWSPDESTFANLPKWAPQQGPGFPADPFPRDTNNLVIGSRQSTSPELAHDFQFNNTAPGANISLPQVPSRLTVLPDYSPSFNPPSNRTLFGEPLSLSAPKSSIDSNKAEELRQQMALEGKDSITDLTKMEGGSAVDSNGLENQVKRAVHETDRLNTREAEQDAELGLKVNEHVEPYEPAKQLMDKEPEAVPPPVIQRAVTRIARPSQVALAQDRATTSAVKDVKTAYDSHLKGMGVYSLVLDKVSDVYLRQQIEMHLDSGLSLPDAVERTSQGVINALNEAGKVAEERFGANNQVFKKGDVEHMRQTTKSVDPAHMAMDPGTLAHMYVEAGYLAEGLRKNGALKVGDWIDHTKEMLQEKFGYAMPDADLQKMWFSIKDKLDLSQEVVDGKVKTKEMEKQERLNAALGSLDEEWNKVPPEKRGGHKSPAEKIVGWFNDIRKNGNFSNHTESEDAMINAIGAFRFKDGNWIKGKGTVLNEGQVRAYLNQAAHSAFKASSKSRSGGEDVITDVKYKDLNAAREAATKFNKEAGENPGYTFDGALRTIEGVETPVILKQWKQVESASDLTLREPVRGRDVKGGESLLTEDGVGGHLVDAGGSDPYTFVEGEGVVDPLDTVSDAIERVVASSDTTTGEVIAQTIHDVMSIVKERLSPSDPTVQRMPVRNLAQLVARARVLMEYHLDKRLGGTGNDIDGIEFFGRANAVLPPEAQFKDTKQATNWISDTGQKFLFGWLRQQPEMVELMDRLSGRSEVVEGEQRALKGGGDSFHDKVDVSHSIEEGKQTGFNLIKSAKDFALKYFSRKGMTDDQTEAYANAVDRFIRIAAVFKQAEHSHVDLLRGAPDNVRGLNTALIHLGEWKNVISLTHVEGLSSEVDFGLTLAHEAWHTVETLYASGKLSKTEMDIMAEAYELADKLSPTEKLQALRMSALDLPESMQRSLSTSSGSLDSFNGFLLYSTANSREFMSTMSALYAARVAHSSEPSSKGALKNLMLYGDGAFTSVMNSMFNAASGIISAVKGLFALGTSDFKLFSDIEWMDVKSKKKIDFFELAFRSMSRSAEEIDKAVSSIRFLDSTTPENILESFTPAERNALFSLKEGDDLIKQMYAKTLPFGDPNEIGKTESWAMDFMQLAAMEPILQPYAGELLSARGMAVGAQNDLMSPMFERSYVNGRTEVKGVGKDIEQFSKSLKERTALNDQILDEQQLQHLSTPQELAALDTLHKVTPAERVRLNAVRATMVDQAKIGANIIVQSNRMKIVHIAAKMMMSGKDIPYKHAIDGADRLVGILEAQNGGQPLPAGVDPNVLMQSITGDYGIPPDKVALTATGLGAQGGIVQQHFNLKTKLEAHPEFITEQRYGRFAATYRVAGETKPGRISADTHKELQRRVDMLSRDPKVSQLEQWDNSESTTHGINPSILDDIRAIGKNAHDLMTSTMTQDEARAAQASFEAADTAMDKEMNARGMNKYLQYRKITPGRETLDMFENHIRYVTSLPSATSKQFLRDRTSVVLQDPSYIANPSAAKVARQQMENAVASTSNWSNKVREWAFTYFPAANLSSALIELTQPLMALPAELTKGGLSLAKGYGLLGQAYKLVTQAYTTGAKRYTDPFIDNMLYRMENAGMLESGMNAYTFDTPDLNALNLARAHDGNITPLSLAQAAGNQVSHIPSMMRSVYGHATGVSSRVTTVVAALRAKQLITEGKLTQDGAFDYVRNLVSLTAPGTAGKAGRPNGFYNGKWIPRSAAGALGSLQGFAITMSSMMYRLGKDAVKSGKFNSQSSKAFAQMFGTQLLAAGVLGLPGIGTAMAVGNQMFPGLTGNIRKGITNLFGDDNENGGPTADAAMRGLPSRIFGVDLSTRLSLGGVLGVSSYDGASAAHLFGAPGAMVGNAFNAADAARQGNFGEALAQAAPTPFKNILNLYRNGGEAREQNGNLIYSPTGAEKFAMGIGFTPKRMADTKDFNREAKISDKAAGAEHARIISEVAEHIIRGDNGGARAILIEQEKQKPGEFSAVEGLKAALEQAQNMTLPEDPRRGGSKMNSNERAELLRTYGIAGPSPSETARLMQRTQSLAAFGLGGGLDRSEMMKANMTDQLMSQSNITRVQARAQVDKMMQRKPQQQLN